MCALRLSGTACVKTPSAASSEQLVAAAELATTALRRRVPLVVAMQIVGFLAGSSGWHMDDAAAYGRLDHMRLLQAPREFTAAPLCSSLAMDSAAGSGHLAVVRWLHAHRSEGCSQMAFYNAAKHAQLLVLQWLFTHKCTSEQRVGLESGVLYHAIQAGQASVVQWLCSQRPAIDPLYNAFDHACRCGHLDVVTLLHELGRQNPKLSKGSKNAMDTAADQGRLELVQWLHYNRTEGCSTNAMDYAAARGHLHVLQWLHRNRAEGCTRRALLNAVSGGHAEIAQWLLREKLVEADAELLKQAMEFAAYHDHKPLWTLLARQRGDGSARNSTGDLYIATRMRLAA